MDRKARARPPKPRKPPQDPSAQGGAWAFDSDLDRVRLSEGARRLIGAPEVVGLAEFLARLPVAVGERARAGEALRDCVRGGADFDLRLVGGDGVGLPALRLFGGFAPAADGAPGLCVGAVLEIGSERDLADEIAERAAHLRSILDTALDGMVVIDSQGVIQAFNSAAARMFGYSEAETLGRNVSMLMGEHDRSRHDGYLSRYHATGERRIIGIGRIVTGLRKDGSQFPLHLAVGETSVAGRRLFTGFVHDLTEERRSESRVQALQSELAHISRLSALGEMGSALAHELNQPLAAIGNYITGSRRLIADAPGPVAARVENALEKAAEQVMRAGHIIRRLRDFVSRRAVERRPESLAKLVEEASALGLVGAREKGVTLKYELDPDCDRVFVDRIQIEQVLVNLLRNGLDAMGSDRRELSVSSRRGGPDIVEVSVADSGAGIAADAMARLFEPFFTTKSAGLGVGLSICRGIVEAHGGEMRAQNNETGGATVSFTLPLAGADPS